VLSTKPAQDGSTGIQHLIATAHQTATGAAIRTGLHAAVLAAVQRPQLGQLPPQITIMDAHVRAVGRHAGRHRHVLEVGFVRGGTALQKQTRVKALVTRKAVSGIVVHHLVVVPGQDPGVGGV
jgi:hypothetical protein